MAYQQNIPLATDQLSTSQGDIQANFQAIYTLIGVNHSNFGTANVGKHNFVSLPVQAGNPGTTTTELALYTKTSALSGLPEAFFQRQNNGTAIEFTSSTASQNGWTRLPSGILLKWGQSNGSGSVGVALPVGATIPVFANVFVAGVFPFLNGAVSDPNLMATLIGFTTTTVSAWCGPRTTTGSSAVTFNYIIIGN